MKQMKKKNDFLGKLSIIVLCLVLGCLLSASPLTDQATQSRDQVETKYKWNVEAIYPSPAAWEADKKEVAAKFDRVASFKGKLGDSAQTFYEALSYLFDLYRRLDKIYVYAEMLSDQDTSQPKPMAMKGAAGKMYTDLSSLAAYIEPEILALPPAKVENFFKTEPRLAPYKGYVADIQRMKQHTLKDREEAILARAGNIVGIAQEAHNILLNAEIPFPEVTFSDGSKAVINVPGYGRYRASSKREDRIKAYQAFYTALGNFNGTLGTLLYGKIKENLFYTNVRGYGSALENALYPKKIPTGVYTNLIKSVRKALPVLHRYLTIKRKMMGLDKLYYHDLYPDLVKGTDTRYAFDEARRIILEALTVLGKEYTGKLREAFDNRWIDVFPNKGKASGAYSTGSYDTTPYIKLNYIGKFDDISMAAHELGHSVHTYFSNKNQPYPTANYASFIAEVAATVNEALVSNYILKTTKDPQERLALLGSFMEACRMTLYRQTLFAEYELVLNQMAEKGESLTGETFDRVYLDLLKEYYGHDKGVTVIDPLYAHEWGYIAHFYLGFYNYNYSTSFAAAHAIAEKIGSQGKPMVKKYIDVLSSGNTIAPIPLLKKLDVDMTTEEPMDLVVKKMERALDEIEKLIKK